MSLDLVERSLAASYGPASATCLDCGAPVGGRFCAACGQRAVAGRLTVSALAADFAGQFLALDRGLWFTALAVLRDPGGVARRFVDGQRRRFVGPIGFLSFAAAVMLLASSLLSSHDLQHIRENVRPLSLTGALSSTQSEAYAQLLYALSQQEALLSLALAVPVTLVVRWLLRRRGVNLAEAGVLSLYLCGDACLLYALCVPLIWLAHGSGGVTPQNVTYAAYTLVAVQAGRGFFDRRVGTAIRMLSAVWISFAVFGILFAVGTMTYVRLTVPR